VLEAYDFVRQPRANMILRRSVWAGELYDSLQGDDDGEVIASLRKQLSTLWNPVWHHDLGQDVEVALQRLRDMGTFV
ncbi:hypothetical protein K503DRAFT_691684, partial [Rhizopogon vinicolor AM-OR11-026]